MSIIAVIVASAGTVYAVTKIDGKTIKKSSIPGNRLKPNTVGGKQVKESRLGVVPHAALADRATLADEAVRAQTVGGVAMRTFSVKVPSGQGETTLVDFGGVTLIGRCEFGGAGQHGLQAEANPGTPSMAAAVTATNTDDNSTDSFRSTNFTVLDLHGPGAPPATHGRFTAVTTTGVVTEISYYATDAGVFSPNENVCLFSGTISTG